MSEDRPTLPILPSEITGLAGVPEPPTGPPEPPAWLSQLPDDSNPFAKQLRDNPELGTVSPAERARLDAIDAFYRGSVTGSSHLKLLGDVAGGAPAVDPNTGRPHPYLTQETARGELDQIRNDLARYDSMPWFNGPVEAAAGLAGTLAGGALSPESFITRFPGAARAATWLGSKVAEPAAAVVTRIMDAALSQGAVQVVTDPLAQAGSLSTGIDKDYNWWRTGLAFPLGAIFGGFMGAGHEAANALLRDRLATVPRETPAGETVPPATEGSGTGEPTAPAVEAAPPTAAPTAEAPRVDTLTEAAPAVSLKENFTARQLFEEGRQEREYDILDNEGNSIGKAYIAVDGSKAEIGHIGIGLEDAPPEAGMNALGPRQIRSLARAFFEENPEVQTIQGNRITGARRGTAEQSEKITITRDQIFGTPRVDTLMEAPARYTTEPDHEVAGQFVAKDSTGKVVAVGASPEEAVQRAQLREGEPAAVETITQPEFKATIAAAGQDLEAATNQLNTRITQALAEGREVTLYADGGKKAVPITAVTRGMMQDAKGQRWGTMDLATHPGTRVEISGRPGEAAAAAATPRAPESQLAREAVYGPPEARVAAEDPSARIVPDTPAADVERERLQETAQQEAIDAAAARGQAEAAPAAKGAAPQAAPEVQFAQQRPAAAPPAGAAAGAAIASDTLRTLHQQSFDLAEALDTSLHQGRVRSREAAGQYDSSQDVIRNRVLADVETTAHEAGHALERHVGPEMTALTQRFAHELGPLDYDPKLARVTEGFAEWMRHYLTAAPGVAEREAPGFYTAFREFMAREQPDLLAKLDRARAAYQAWWNASPGARLEAVVQRKAPDTIGSTIRRDGFAPTVSLWIRRFYQTVFDENAPWTRTVRQIALLAREASGARMNIPAARNPEVLARLNARAVQTAQEALSLGVVPYHGSGFGPQGPSLRQVLTTAHGARTVSERLFGRWNDRVMTDLDSYLAARALEQRWAQYDAGEIPNVPGPLTKPDLAQAIQDLERAHPTFPQAADEWTEMTRQMLRKGFDAGLLPRDVYERLVQQPFYAPLNRVLDDQPVRAAGMGGTRGTARGVELFQRFGGSMRDIVSPIQSIEAQMFMLERKIADNDISKALVSLAREARGAGALGIGRIVEEIPPHEITGTRFDLHEAIKAAGQQHGIDPNDLEVLLSGVIDMFGEDPVMGTIFRAAPAKARGEMIKFYMDGGELRAMRIGDADLYTLMTSMPPAMRDAALTWLAISSTALREGVTKNPVWMLSNYIKDQIAASILQPGYVPFNPRGIIRTVRDDGWTSAYAIAGGISPGLASAELEQVVNHSIDALARRGYTVQVLGSLRDALPYSGKPQKLRGLARGFSNVVNISETGTRMNIFERVFKQKKRQGLSDYEAAIEAAAQARDLLDFGRHGSRTLAIRSIVTFLNANMQAVDKARRQFIQPVTRAITGGMATRQDQEALKKAMYSWLIAGAGGTALGYAYGLLMGKDELYQDADPTVRATYLVIPGGIFGRDHDIVLAPKPFELAIGWNLGEAAGLHMATGDPRAYANAMQGVADVLLPPNWSHPTVLGPTAELALNRSYFTGRELVRPDEQGRPAAQQFRPGTSDVAKAIGAAIGISPIKIDYAAGAYFGNLGRDIIHAADAFNPDAPDIPPENAMFLRRFLKQADVGSQTTQTFWRLAGQQNSEYVGANNAYNTAIQEHRDKDAMDFLGQLPPNQRAYVTLQSGADENGKPAFKADEKALQPLTRAAKAVSLINGMVNQLNVNAQSQWENGERLTMNSTQRRDAIDGLRAIQAMEMRNALVIAGEPAYAGRKLLSVEDEFAVLQAKLPAVADELAARYASEHIYKTAEIAKAWPQAQRRLLRDGSAAELRDLAIDVRVEGPEFEGERVRHPQRRRMTEIPALPPEVAATMEAR